MAPPDAGLPLDRGPGSTGSWHPSAFAASPCAAARNFNRANFNNKPEKNESK